MELKVFLALSLMTVLNSRSCGAYPQYIEQKSLCYESGSDVHADVAKMARNSQEDAKVNPSGSYTFIGANGKTYTITMYDLENNGLLSKYSTPPPVPVVDARAMENSRYIYLIPTPPPVPAASPMENAISYRPKVLSPYNGPNTFAQIADRSGYKIMVGAHLPTLPEAIQ